MFTEPKNAEQVLDQAIRLKQAMDRFTTEELVNDEFGCFWVGHKQVHIDGCNCDFLREHGIG